MSYTRVNWQNKPSTATPINATNLNTMDAGIAALDTAMADKVDKVAGKGLSTEDYTTEEKTKLAGIEDGAEVNVQADWDEADNTADDYIKNKPDLSVYAERDELWGDGTASGNPVTLKTQSAQAAKSTELTLRPIQDLHGYSKPWVGGAGKNKSSINAVSLVKGTTDSVEEECAKIPAGDYIITNTPSGTATVVRVEFLDANMASVGTSGTITSSPVNVTLSSDVYYIRVYLGSSNPNGSTFSTSDLMIRASTELDATFAPYENICPITGRTGAEIVTQGVNLWDEVTELGIINQTTGQNQNANNQIRSKNYTAIQPNTKYCFLCKGSRISQIFWYNKNNEYLSYTQNTTDSTFITTSPANAYYVRFQFPMAYGTTYQNDGGVNYPSSYTDYSAHTEQTVTRNYGQTVYGGSDNVETGVLSVEWAYIASYNGETITEPWISDRDEYVPNTTPSTGAEVAYKLASPTTNTLTAAQVNLLKGINNISTDADSLTITYFNDAESLADADNRITGVLGDFAKVEGKTASQNYAIGDYLIFSDKFCKASSAIASGETLAIGFNLTQTTIGAELKAILAQI